MRSKAYRLFFFYLYIIGGWTDFIRLLFGVVATYLVARVAVGVGLDGMRLGRLLLELDLYLVEALSIYAIHSPLGHKGILIDALHDAEDGH